MKLTKTLSGCVAALALLGAACSSDSDQDGVAAEEPLVLASDGFDEPADGGFIGPVLADTGKNQTDPVIDKV